MYKLNFHRISIVAESQQPDLDNEDVEKYFYEF